MIGLGNDLRKFKAKKVDTDPGTDVALLKIDENNLPSVNFADSDKARARRHRASDWQSIRASSNAHDWAHHRGQPRWHRNCRLTDEIRTAA
jgi:hypothetical protein